MSSFDSSDDEKDEVYDEKPLDISWCDFLSYHLPGVLGVTSLPGCRFGKTWRNLVADIEQLKEAKVTDVYPLVTKSELTHYRTRGLLKDYAAAGFSVHYYPMQDGMALDPEYSDKLLTDLLNALKGGKTCLIHCFGGLGRSCTVLACLWLSLDQSLDADGAIERSRQLRGPGAVQSIKQYNFIHEYSSQLSVSQTAVENIDPAFSTK